MPSVTFRLPPTLHERLHKHLEDKDLKASDFFRNATEAFLDRIDDAPYVQTPTRTVDEREVVQRAVALHALKPVGAPRVRGFSALGGEAIMRSDGPLETVPKRGKK